MYARVILVLLLFVFLALGAYQREGFAMEVVAANEEIAKVNNGTQPWNRHPIESVAYLQMRPAFQRGIRHHANAAYYELDNHTYDIALKKAFAYSCGQQSGPWSEMATPSIANVPKALLAEYPEMIAFLQSRIRTSPSLRTVQIVHDHWVGIQRHATRADMYLLSVEAILYQQGKFQGKHVSFSVMADMGKRPTAYVVTQSRVEGVISEDKIGMFPVVAQEYNISGADYMTVPNDPLMSYPTRLLDPEIIQSVLETQKNKLNRNLAAQLYVADE